MALKAQQTASSRGRCQASCTHIAGLLPHHPLTLICDLRVVGLGLRGALDVAVDDVGGNLGRLGRRQRFAQLGVGQRIRAALPHRLRDLLANLAIQFCLLCVCLALARRDLGAAPAGQGASAVC